MTFREAFDEHQRMVGNVRPAPAPDDYRACGYHWTVWAAALSLAIMLPFIVALLVWALLG